MRRLGDAIRFTELIAGALALGSGCAHEYLYAPVGTAVTGEPVARYLVPPSAPRGEVYVTSFGFAELQIGPARTAMMLHLRLAVSNGSSAPWTVDGRAQRAVATGETPQGPAFLNTNAGAGPVYEVLPGRANVFDLYYALAPPLDPEYVGGFALDWSVSAGGEVVADRTSCLRYQAAPISYAPYPPYVAVGLGFGSAWWHDSSYSYAVPPHPPVLRSYYFPPGAVRASAWRGVPLAAWRGTALDGGRGRPPAVTTPSLRAAPVSRPFVSRMGRGWHSEGLPFRGGR